MENDECLSLSKLVGHDPLHALRPNHSIYKKAHFLFTSMPI